MISEDHVTLKTAVMMLKIHRNKLQFNSFILQKYFTILYFGLNNCSLGEQKRLLSKNN